MAEYTFTYFDGRGTADPIRMILTFAGAKWTDNRIPLTNGAPIIPESIKEKLRFGQVPLLEFEGARLFQIRAIARYLARKFNLVGKGELEEARCDEVVDACLDIDALIWPLLGKRDAENVEKARKTAMDRFYTDFNKALERQQYIVGHGLTWADLFLAHVLYQFQRLLQVNVTDDFPNLKKHLELVNNHPGIKEWIEKRPDTPF